jgi:hypothetical protein
MSDKIDQGYSHELDDVNCKLITRRSMAASALFLAAGLSLPSRQATAQSGSLCSSYSQLVSAVAAVGSTGGLVQCQPGAVITFGSSPLLIANKNNLTLDLTGAEIQATTNVNGGQFYQPALICLQNCNSCTVKGSALISVNGYASSALGLQSCTNCNIEHLTATGCNIGFGQFFSVGSVRCAWRFCDSLSGQATARGFWLGGDQSIWGETDVEITGCRAIGNPATGIIVVANGAKIIGNTSTDNNGAGIASSSNGGGGFVSYYHTVANNDCRRNAFWGWQSDSSTSAQLYNATVTGNLFDKNTAGAAQLYACSTFMYANNIDNGLVAISNCSGGKVQLGPGATLQNGGANTNVTFS